MFLIALLLGVVEGLTEFLPISSTGHLIVASELVGFEGPRAEVFQVFIQLGAILAVVVEYRDRLRGIIRDLPGSAQARRLVVSVAIAFVPSALLGLILHDWLMATLFSARSVAAALIAGGLLILVVEGTRQRGTTKSLETIDPGQALGVGLAQCLALWPGFSRSAATILGGLVCQLDRRTATEFSFFLAMPTMVAACSYNLLRFRHHLTPTDLWWLGLAFMVSMLVAWVSIRWLLRFISNHSFRPFAWYRLLLGTLILLVLNGH